MSLIRQSLRLLKNPNVQRPLLSSIKAQSKIQSRNIKRWVAPTMRVLRKRREQIGPDPIQPRSTFLEWNYDAEIFAFGKRLGEEFDEKLLRQALIHRSYVSKQELEHEKDGINANDNSIDVKDNSELIQKGEDIINDYIQQKLWEEHPKYIVEAVRAYLTTDDMLSHVASHVGLKDIVLTSEFPVEKKTLADTFRAVISALEQCSGKPRAELFVNDFLLVQLVGKDVYEIWDPENPYNYLVSLLKAKGITEVEPRLCNASATNTILANYQVGLYSNKSLLGIGWGESVDIAKETAAIDAIKNLNKNYAVS